MNNAQLVKIDVVTADLGKSVQQVFDLVDGSTVCEKGFLWVFNLANAATGNRRDLRFWRPEIQARLIGDSDKFLHFELPQVVARILPESRLRFCAGEVDKLFQIRPRTRIDFGAEIKGRLQERSYFYTRADLAAFLTRRWIGA